MKALITGGSGLLGQYLNIFLSQKSEILTLYCNNLGNCNKFNSKKVDLRNFSLLSEIFKTFEPDVIIHTAAYARPEIAEKLLYKEVYELNVNTTKFIAEQCELYKAKLIFTSTDLVYDGNQGQMITEEGKINPLSVYANTKYLAEEEIKRITENYIILRTSLLYGIALNNTYNNFSYIYQNLRAGKKVKLFYDQYRTPLSLINAAMIIIDLINQGVKSEIFNFGGLERVSRVKLGEILCEVAGLDKALIEKISMDDVPGVVKVPDVSLNTKKLQAYSKKQKSIKESIKEILNYGKN